MEIDKQYPIERFSALSNAELQRRITAGTLTALAEEVARAELASRGVDVSPVLDAEPSVAAPPDDIDLVMLFRTNDVFQANVLRMHLESEGIFARVWGEHLGVAHLIWSTAAGGVGVQVRSDQLELARDVLRAFERGDYALGEEEQPD